MTSNRLIDHLYENFSDTAKLNLDYVKNPPYPHLVLDNFIDEETVCRLKSECDSLQWTRKFTRNGSKMLERQDLSECDAAMQVYQQFSSKEFLTWLGTVTGHDDLIPDPYMIGAGYMRCARGDSLKLHTDFNYNDKLGLYRMLSLNIYLNNGWMEEWNGDLQFWDFERKKCVSRYFPLGGRAIIWRYHKYGFHGHPNPLQCPEDVYRDGLRIFYYVSGNAPYKLDRSPHRSLYWFDQRTGKPYDVQEEE